MVAVGDLLTELCNIYLSLSVCCFVQDFSKLREMNQIRLSRQTGGGILRPCFGMEVSPFWSSSLSSSRRFFWSSMSGSGSGGSSNLFGDSRLKWLERTANQHPQDPNAQFEFVSELAQRYPKVAVERYSMDGFAMDERLAILYLASMQTTQTYHAFALDRFLSRLQTPDGTKQAALEEFVATQKGGDLLSKPQQVAKVLGILTGGMAMSGAAATPLVAAAGSVGTGSLLGARGMDAKSPLYVQLSTPRSTRSALFSLARQVLLAFVTVSALTAVMDEKGVGRAMGMNNSKHIQEAEGSSVKFDDVKGVTEAKAELEEIVEYLKDPTKFTRLGGTLPRGLLLTGPPGTGKTLLAKAIAGEAGVPFYFSSGSQFEEVYVGLGAKRIRELFEAAKKKAPAIIFIDEIDAVGGTRRLKDQSALKMTLNELLVQLDGFEENNGIIVIGATNFMESLDSALLRPGRFDKHVQVPLPDVGGRKEILELYAQKTKLAKDVDLGILARGTTGFSGADLFNLMNQAALKASVEGLNSISMSVLEYAKDKILMGAERKTAVISPKTAQCTAFHEAGHALVAVLTDGAMPIHKATIMPRGPSLGMVMMLPEGDQTSQSYKEMLASLDVAMGGRVAEELVFGPQNVTSGAMGDISMASRTARAMVTKYGFSREVGLVYHGGTTGEESASAETRARIDEEVKMLLQAAYERAKELLRKHSKTHHLLAETLLEYETLTGDEVRDLVQHGMKPKRPVLKSSNPQNSSNKRSGSTKRQAQKIGWGRASQES
mmetsp:Transcript_4732/g.10655  ORF Transcript_4732/g.10655 Transcript_4732/m.10655 type:complete len:774 (-) Transcript_4732:340-2661(-)